MPKTKLTGPSKRIYGGLLNRLSQQLKIGESRHLAKKKARELYRALHGNLKGHNPARAEGIFSIGTAKSYRQTMVPLSIFMADQGIKNASQITPELAGLFLQERDASGLSPQTISREMSAINKILGYSFTKKQLGLRLRSKNAIKNNRSNIPLPKRTKYENHIILLLASGVRRSSIAKITANDCIRNELGQVIGIHVKEKGGKERIAPILNDYKNIVTEIVDRYAKGNTPLFDKLGSHIPSHRLRAEYCARLLTQLTQEYNENQLFFGGDLSAENYINLRGKDAKHGDTYRGFPTVVVATISGALGHNRLDIIFSHYDYMIPYVFAMTNFVSSSLPPKI